jgi:hypothetical protein
VSSGAKPSVLIGYYTHTQHARRVADMMTEALRDRGCEASPASIDSLTHAQARAFADALTIAA